MSAEKKLKELKIDLGTVSAPVANYVNAVRTGNLLYLAGKGPPGRHTPRATSARTYTVEEAYQHARTVGLNLMAVMRDELGSLDKVKRIVKVLGMVNAVPGFDDQPKVINGCSDLFRPGARRKGQARALRSRHGIAPHGHPRGDRGDRRSRIRNRGSGSDFQEGK